MRVYIIGSLRNPLVPQVAARLRTAGFDAFDDWYSAGPEADDHWQAHQKSKGLKYHDAINGPAAQNTFDFDRRNLERSDAVVMVAPAGKSAHLELGYAIGHGIPGFILMDEPGKKDRWDVMYAFATDICHHLDELPDMIRAYVILGAAVQEKPH